MSANELNIFLNSFHRPANYSDSAWSQLLNQSREVWNLFLTGEDWKEKLDITCKEAYLMLVDKEGKLIIKDDTLLNYVQNQHVSSWKKRLEEIAYKAIRDKRYSIAERYFGKLIKLDSTNAMHYYRRALTRLQTLKNKAALSDLNEAVRINPNVAVFYLKRAAAYRILDVDHKAMADLNSAIRLNPESNEAYSTRGKFRMSLNDRAGGRLDLLKAEEIISRNNGSDSNSLNLAA
jgi:tetratricopeptide (TPR) repeat protein